eukprot:g16963.t1
MGNVFGYDGGQEIHVTDRKSLLLQWILERNDWFRSRPVITADGKLTQPPLAGAVAITGTSSASSSSGRAPKKSYLNTTPDPSWAQNPAAQVFLDTVYGGPENARKAREKLGLVPSSSAAGGAGASASGSGGGNEGEKVKPARPCVRPGKNKLLPFLDENVLPIVIEFLFGGSLLKCFEVSPLWFCCFLEALDRLGRKIDDNFRKTIDPTGILQLEYARTDWSPLHVCRPGVRVDRVLIAKVQSRFAGKTVRLKHEYAYESVASSPKRPSELAKSIYEAHFQFDIFSGSRNLWIHKDICRFHGDETRVAALQNITPVRVGDRIEIAVNLFNAFGKTRLTSVKWHQPLTAAAPSARPCSIDEEHTDWFDFDTFSANCQERLQLPNFFAPQLVHRFTNYAGLDVAVSRSYLHASEIGPVPLADKILGLRIEVLPRYAPIILPLKRIGLLHDRFTKIQLRQGDVVKLYITQGGRVVQQQESVNQHFMR